MNEFFIYYKRLFSVFPVVRFSNRFVFVFVNEGLNPSVNEYFCFRYVSGNITIPWKPLVSFSFKTYFDESL